VNQKLLTKERTPAETRYKDFCTRKARMREDVFLLTSVLKEASSAFLLPLMSDNPEEFTLH
jgi:hypothetical protein